MNLQEVKRALDGHSIADVSTATGLHYNTVWMIARGKHPNPTISTINKLSAYLEGAPKNE